MARAQPVELSSGYVARAGGNSNIIDLSAREYSGRYENSNPFYTPQLRDYELHLAENLGLTPEDAYDAAAEFANSHFETFHQFYTEGSPIEVITNEISRRLFSRAGVDFTPYALTQTEVAQAGARANDVQNRYKQMDVQKSNKRFGDFVKAIPIVGQFAVAVADVMDPKNSPYVHPEKESDIKNKQNAGTTNALTDAAKDANSALNLFPFAGNSGSNSLTGDAGNDALGKQGVESPNKVISRDYTLYYVLAAIAAVLFFLRLKG